MEQLIIELGIDWKLLLSQVVNFLILLTVLTIFVYKPLIKVIKERNARIKEGLDKAVEADEKLKNIDNIGKEKIREAEAESINIIKATEDRAKTIDKENLEKLDKKQKEAEALLRLSIKKQQEEAKNLVLAEAGELIRKAIIKTVELKPDAIDSVLIKKAIDQVKNEE